MTKALSNDLRERVIREVDGGASARASADMFSVIPKLGNLDSWCPTLCGVDRIVNASRIKCLDGRDKPAATPHIGREQRELV